MKITLSEVIQRLAIRLGNRRDEGLKYIVKFAWILVSKEVFFVVFGRNVSVGMRVLQATLLTLAAVLVTVILTPENDSRSWMNDDNGEN